MKIADTLGVSRSTVITWRKHFSVDGVKGIGKVRPGRGRKPSIAPEIIEKVVRDTQQTTPVKCYPVVSSNYGSPCRDIKIQGARDLGITWTKAPSGKDFQTLQ